MWIHFILYCPTLSTRHHELLLAAPSHVKSLLPDINLDPERFVDVMPGYVWIRDRTTQVYIVGFLDQLRAHQRMHYYSNLVPSVHSSTRDTLL